MCGPFLSRTLEWHTKRKAMAMNPNQMNVAKAMVAQHEYLEEARRSRLQAKAERQETMTTRPRKSFHSHPISALFGHGLLGRR
jgi:hypothetical protein